MPPTLASLAATQGLALRPLTGERGLHREVGWVHVSELPDPTPFLEGGELLLTTGLRLGDGGRVDPADALAYASRLSAAGVVGLGFGVGLSHAAVPAALVEAARACGLPLLEVPLPTPFVAIAKAVSEVLAAERYGTVLTAFRAQQRLARLAASEGAGAVVAETARQVRGWVVLTAADGTPLHQAPPGVADRLGWLGGEIERIRPAGVHASASFPTAGGQVALYSLGTGARVRGFLAVRAGAGAPAARELVGVAASLLTLELERARPPADGERRLAEAITRLLVAGHAEPAAAAAEALWGGLPPPPVRVHLVAADGVATGAGPGDEAARETAVAGLRDALAASGAPPLLTSSGGMVIVVAAGDGPAAAVSALARRLPGVRAGASEPADYADLPGAVGQARQALAAARRGGVPHLPFERLASADLLTIVDGEALRGFAAALLDPLRRGDARGRGQLARSLRAWLGHNAQLDPAAAELGVHRNTLRHRLRRAERLLGRDLGDPATRVELWLALEVEARAAPAGAPGQAVASG